MRRQGASRQLFPLFASPARKEAIMPRAHVVPDGTKLTALRGEADLTQLELARQAGYGLRTIGKIENGQPTGARTLSAAATVLSRRLGRAISLTDLLKRPSGAGSGAADRLDEAGLVHEMVRFLDLSNRSAQRISNGRPQEQRALLVDHFRFERLPARRPTLCFPYVGLGDRAYGECLSHPGQCRWQASAELPAAGGKPRRGYCLQVDISSSTDVLAPMICNGIEYFGAFTGETGDALEVPVGWPTEGLTVLVLFPPSRPCRSARGRPDGTPVQPLIMPGGRLVHWRVNSPPAGTTYRLEWEW
jgi:transcriptional regulator with XRE-family HTH domain